ncbi:hypothetical protein [Tomitella gaofuii]|uniref:hypothetical protein n=1 Tax=Tomitella gaofuii TaxID=2760083 RepID=UPI0015FB3B7B|nr:hypothetical protein [Tomitella gaofuii]
MTDTTWTAAPDTWPAVTERPRIQWELERELAREILASSPSERAAVTGRVYNRLFDRAGGRFLIETPSRLTGPWDISRGFSATASGFHLHGYTNAELGGLLLSAGFARIRGPVLPARVRRHAGVPARWAYAPHGVRAAAEAVVECAPASTQGLLERLLMVRDVTLVATKL